MKSSDGHHVSWSKVHFSSCHGVLLKLVAKVTVWYLNEFGEKLSCDSRKICNSAFDVCLIQQAYHTDNLTKYILITTTQASSIFKTS